MATIQAKYTKGNKYWYIVESRRINGKPRPVVLEYLGKADDLLKRLRGIKERYKVKSYAHGAVSALLNAAHKLDVQSVINKYIKSSRKYQADKPIRNHLTVGMTFLLGAVGRVCELTSKDGWYKWAKTTSFEYLLRSNFCNIDSQHFWDMMDCFPVNSIKKAENELLQKVLETYGIESDTLFFDTTNFHTFIASTNQKNTLAQRGQNKQKRNDLRQVGLAMAVTRQDFVPLFHFTYKGNMNDNKVFRTVIGKLKNRMKNLEMDLEKHTLVFDRGNISKKNLAIVKNLKFHYVSALTPYHHKKLIDEAIGSFKEIEFDDRKIQLFRRKKEIWGEERTVLVFISDKLKAGQLRGIYQTLEKKEKKLSKIQSSLSNPRGKKREKAQLETKIKDLLKVQYVKDIIKWSLTEQAEGKFQLDYFIDQKKLDEIEDKLGYRILITDRHNWEASEIIKAYHGQSIIENVFKNIKNLFHIAFRPQYHWTDQKIKVHFFICVIGYLLSSIVWRQARVNAGFKGTLDNLLDSLTNVRLATLLEESRKRGKVKTIYKLEEMTTEESNLMEALSIKNFHNIRPKFRGVSVYN